MAVKNKSGNLLNKAKVFLSKFFIPIAIVSICIFILLARANINFVENAKAHTLDIINPIINVISYPSKGISYLIDTVKELANIRDENIRLREENKILIEWRNYAQKLEGDIERLIKTTNYVPPPEASFVTAKIIADAGSSLSQTMITLAGKHNGVKKNMIAITDAGVVGRVLYAGNNTSRILLLNDINSRLPVTVGKEKLRAMLIGTNKKNPIITFLPIDTTVNIGDKVTTSGIGGIFPADLNVGVVTDVQENNITVELYADRNLISFVKIVDYKLENLAPEKDVNEF